MSETQSKNIHELTRRLIDFMPWAGYYSGFAKPMDNIVKDYLETKIKEYAGATLEFSTRTDKEEYLRCIFGLYSP